ASSKAEVRDTNDQPTGDEASAVTEATGATVNIAVARAAARAASIATSTVMRNGGGVSRYRILISTQCDVEPQPQLPLARGDINDGWCQAIENSQGKGHSSNQSASGEHILKLLPGSAQNSLTAPNPQTHTVVTEEQLLVTSSAVDIPKPEMSVESAYIESSGDEESASETDTTESENFQTSESDSGAVQPTKIRAQTTTYRSVLQQQLSEAESASNLNHFSSSNQLQSDQERMRRAKDVFLRGRDSLWEQLLDRGTYTSKLIYVYQTRARRKTEIQKEQRR
ncbi:hypothetical protein BOX15_Mlig026199g2, partial [Macrostomum lignano]